jgi:uncharacterized protein (TIGR02118 family)
MIRIAGLYSNKPGAKFDHDYYINKHMKMVYEKFRPMGLVKVEVDKGVSGMGADVPPPYVAIGYMVFNSIEDFQKADAAHGANLVADQHNFTNIEPQMQISEIIL